MSKPYGKFDLILMYLLPYIFLNHADEWHAVGIGLVEIFLMLCQVVWY